MFQPRPYQLPLINAFNSGYKRILCIWPRRAGKDVVSFNLMVSEAIAKVGVYYYIFPTYSQGKKVIYDSINSSGQPFLDYIPASIIKSKNSQELKITLINSSIIQIVGSDNIDSLMGTNPRGCVFSEYALQDSRAYQFLRPILVANGGWSLFVSTPRGKNSLFELYNIALKNPEWYVSKLTVDDTKHISREDIQKEEDEGLMSSDLIQQEFYTSFDMGVEGSYYARYMDKLRLKGQIGKVNWDPSLRVHTSWDIGVRDSTCIIFWQSVGTNIHIIDAYEKSKEGLEHYIQVINSKPWASSYGKHVGPHDLRVREFTSGIARVDKARQLGVQFTIADNLSIEDGIEAVRTALPKMYIDEKNCSGLIKALENYRQEYDSKKKVYKSQPLHDQFSHFCDAIRYLSISLPKMRDGMTVEDIKKLRAQAHGDNTPYNNFGHPTQEEYDRNRSSQW